MAAQIWMLRDQAVQGLPDISPLDLNRRLLARILPQRRRNMDFWHVQMMPQAEAWIHLRLCGGLPGRSSPVWHRRPRLQTLGELMKLGPEAGRDKVPSQTERSEPNYPEQHKPAGTGRKESRNCPRSAPRPTERLRSKRPLRNKNYSSLRPA